MCMPVISKPVAKTPDNIDVWAGAIPEIIPGLLGGSIIPPI